MDTISARVNSNNKLGEVRTVRRSRCVFLDPVNHLDFILNKFVKKRENFSKRIYI